MAFNVKSVEKLPKYNKNTFYYDKKGKLCKKVVEVNDDYLVTMINNSSVVLNSKQMNEFKIFHPDIAKIVTKKEAIFEQNVEIPTQNVKVVENSPQINEKIVENSEETDNGSSNNE